MNQGGLFAEPLISGLDYRDELVSVAEHDELVVTLSSLELMPFRFHGWTGHRKTKSYGWRYDFDDSTFASTEPIPDWLMPLRAKAAVFANIAPEDFEHALLARYDAGAGIGWHRDRPQFDRVVGISLASSAVMRLRQRTDGGFRRSKLHLAPRSAYLLSGPSRREWEHSISPGEQLRFSITFRTLSPRGLAVASRQ